jgi:hypothetical protein
MESRNRFPAGQAGMTTLFEVPARQATEAGGIESSESIAGLHKRLQIGAQTEKDREEGLCQQRSNVQQDDNGHAVLTAKIYCTFVCFVELFQSILMYGGQRLKLTDTSREGAVSSKTAQYSFPDKYSQE